MVYPTDNNANADWSMNDVIKSILLEYAGHTRNSSFSEGPLIMTKWDCLLCGKTVQKYYLVSEHLEKHKHEKEEVE
jgi:hypothetical protein